MAGGLFCGLGWPGDRMQSTKPVPAGFLSLSGELYPIELVPFDQNLVIVLVGDEDPLVVVVNVV